MQQNNFRHWLRTQLLQTGTQVTCQQIDGGERGAPGRHSGGSPAPLRRQPHQTDLHPDANTDLQVLDARAVTTFEEELARDVITLMTVFCARLYGRRSGRNKRISDARDEGPRTA